MKADTAKSTWFRFIPVGVILGGILMAWQSGVLDLLSFDALYQQRTALQNWVDQTGGFAAVMFAAGYALLVAFSLPAGAALTVIAGFLFGPLIGTLSVVGGATIGATAIFIVAQTALGDTLRKKAGPFLDKMQSGFQANATSYMLVLRLIPAFPFWLVNIVPALAGVRLFTYIWTTFVGILPGTFVFILFGGGLDSVFLACDQQLAKNPSAVCSLPPASEILTPQIWMAFTALAILALAPMVYRRLKPQQQPELE